MHSCYGTVTKHPCGCETVKCAECGVSHSRKKCELHMAEYPHRSGSQDYYGAESAGIVDGIPRNRIYVEQWREAFEKKLNSYMHDSNLVVEVGAGIGRLVPYLYKRGLDYMAIEPDRWACEYLREAYGALAVAGDFMDVPVRQPAKYVIAAHVLEHLPDAQAALHKMVSTMKPGGKLFLVVPDDRDLLNPDHHWFFTAEGLKAWCEEAGLVDVKYVKRRVVEHEDFIYLVGRKG